MKRKAHRNPDLHPRGRTMIIWYGPNENQGIVVHPGILSWTKAAEFVTKHFPDFRLVRDRSLAGGHWVDSNGVTIELW